MASIRIIRHLRKLQDVDDTGIAPGDVPTWDGTSFTMGAGGVGTGGGSFSLGVSNLGNTLGETGLTGTRMVLAGIGNITLSQLTGAQGGTISISGGTVAAGAAFSAGVSGGNTSGDTGVTGSRLVFAGGNNVTLSQATDANGGSITISGPNTSAQSVQTQGLFDLTISGNTDGAPQLVSSGTLTLAGGTNITLSQNGNAISIIGAAGGGGTQTAISGIAASNTTYTSGTVTITGVGGGVTVSSNTGQRIDISVAAPVAQTNQAGSVYAVGNTTSSTSGTYDARTLSLRGEGIISIAATNSGFRISATQSVQTQSRFNLTLGGNTAGVMAQISSGTMTLAGGNNVTLSQNGNAVTVSAASQTAQTQNLHNVTLSGNTAGVMAQVSSGTLTWAGGNNITLSQNGNAVTISGPNVGGAQTGISSIAASNTTYTSGQVEFTGSGIVTVQSSANQRVVINASQSVQTQSLFSAGISNLGNTVGDSGVSGTRMVLAGINGITLSQSTNANGNTITVSGATQTVQTQNVVDVTISGNTAGAGALVSSGTLTLAGGNNITVSQAGNAITISGANIGGAQTGISGVAASNTTYTSGTVTITGVGGGITVSSNTGQRIDLSVAAQTNQAGSLYAVGNTTSSTSGTYDARSISLRGDGIISIAATNSGFRISATQSNQAGSLYAIGNTTSSSSGTYDARTLSLSGAGIISIAATNSGFKISATQSVQTQNVVDVTLSGNTSGAMALISSGTMTLAGGNNITVSQAGNAITISGANIGGAQTGISGLANSQTTFTSGTVSLSELGAITIRSTTGNQFQLSVNAQSVQPETQTFLGALVGSDKTYTSGTITLSGVGGGITVNSNAGQRIDLSVAAAVAQTVESQSIGMSNLGNTSGTTGIASGGQVQFLLVGGNNVTLSQSLNGASGTLTISAFNQTAQTQNLHNVTLSGNTAGAMAQISSGTMTLAGGNNVTLSQAGNAVTISGPNTVAQTNQAGSLYAVGNTTSSSSGTYDARTVSLRGDGIISIAATNSGFRISATESVQTQNLHNVTLSGNTAGAMAHISSGTMTLAGGNAITLSQAGNAVTISGAAQTNQAGSLYAIGNTTSSSSGTWDARTLSLSGAGIISIAATNSGFKISASESVQTQNLHNVTLSGNTSGAMAQISSGTMTLAGGNNITLSQAGNAITISGANIGGAQTGISGIANSQTTYTSGTVSLSELGAITIRSTTGNQFQFSVNSQTVQTQNQVNVTLSGNTAGAMAHISSGTMTLAGGNGITLSQAGNAVTISGGAGGAAFSAGVSTGGNTAGNTGISGTQMVLAGMGAMSLSQTTGANGNTVSILAPASSLLSAVSPLSTSTAGSTISILGPAVSVLSAIAPLSTSSAGSTVSILGPATSLLSAVAPLSTSTNGSTVSILGPAQLSAGLSNIGNTAGNTGLVTARLVLAGGNGITLSGSTDAGSQTITISGGAGGGGIQHLVVSNTTFSSGTVSLSGFGDVTVNTAANLIRISAPVQTVESISLGMSNIGNTSGTTGVASGGSSVRFLFAGGNNITLSQSLNGASGTLTISAASQTVQTQNQVNVTLSGNTAGAMAHISSGTMTMAGGNNITLSQAGNAVTISGPNTVAQTNQAGSLYAIGNTTSSSSGTYDARTLSISGAGMISVAATNSGFKISATQSVQTQNQVNVTLSGNTAGAMAHISSGTMTLAGGNGITLSQAGNAVTISGGAGGAGFSAGVSNVGNTQGQTGVTGTRLVLAGTDNITLSQSTDANGATVRISGQSPAGGAFSGGVSTLGNTAGATGISGTQMVLVGSGVLSLSQTTGANGNTVSLLAPAQSALSAVSPMSLSTNGSTISVIGPNVSLISAVAPLSTTTNGSTISILGPAQLSVGFSTAGNTSGNTGFVTGRLALVGGNGITLSGSTDAGSQTITISGGGGGAGFTGGISGGNVAGDTGTVTGRIVFAGGNGITLSGSTNAGSQTITISGGAGGAGFSAGVSTGGNTAGATGVTGSNLVWVGSGAMSLSQTTGANGGTVSILGPATSSMVGTNGISISTAGSTISIMQATGSAFLTSLAPYDESPMVTGQQGQGTLHLAPVRIPEGIQFDRVGLAIQISNTSNSSGSITLSQWFGLYTKNASSLSLYGSTSITTNFTGSGTVGSYSLYAGPAWQTIPWTTTIPEGDYYAGIIMRTTTGGAAGHSISQLLLSKFTNTAWSGIIGVASATSVQRLLGQGHYSATTSALPASIHFTQLIGSGSIALRSPVWMMRSGTV